MCVLLNQAPLKGFSGNPMTSTHLSLALLSARKSGECGGVQLEPLPNKVTAQNADLLGRRGQWITCPASSVCIKSLLGPKAVFGTSPRTPSSSLITALTTPYCHCLSPQPEGQLRAGRHCCIPCSSHSAWLEYKAQSVRLHLVGIRGHQRHLSRKIP